MSLEKTYFLRCDACGASSQVDKTAKRARQMAKTAGWVRVKGADLCPLKCCKGQKDTIDP